MGDVIDFKDLAGKIAEKDLEGLSEDEAVKFYDSVLQNLDFSGIQSGETEAEELYDEIVDNYFILLNELKTDSFSQFYFADYEECRLICVDGKEYDLDSAFTHDDENAAGALCAIDCLLADLSCCLDCEGLDLYLKEIEKRINKRK